MFKKIVYLGVSIFFGVGFALAAAEETAPQGLDWHDRPESLKACVDQVYDHLAEHEDSRWTFYNGCHRYHLSLIHELRMMDFLVRSAVEEERKDIYFMDVGAGKHNWADYMASYISQKEDLPEDFKVHFYSLRAEGPERSIKEKEHCCIHYLNRCKIEEISEEKELEGLQFDGIVSCWTLRNLVDPLATFSQLYNFLRPRTGLLLLDGFFFLLEDQEMNETDFNQNMARVFEAAKLSFLTNPYNVTRSKDHFVFLRKEDRPCQIPLSYFSEEPLVFVDRREQINSENITRFRVNDPGSFGQETKNHRLETHWEIDDNKPIRYCKAVYGDEELFDLLEQNNLFELKSDKIMGWNHYEKVGYVGPAVKKATLKTLDR